MIHFSSSSGYDICFQLWNFTNFAKSRSRSICFAFFFKRISYRIETNLTIKKCVYFFLFKKFFKTRFKKIFLYLRINRLYMGKILVLFLQKLTKILRDIFCQFRIFQDCFKISTLKISAKIKSKQNFYDLSYVKCKILQLNIKENERLSHLELREEKFSQ